MLFPFVAFLAAQTVPMPGNHIVSEPAPHGAFVVDGELGEWRDLDFHDQLRDAEGAVAGDLAVAHDLASGMLYVAARTTDPAPESQLFLDLTRTDHHDRPVQLTLSASGLEAAQLKHMEGGTVVRSEDGRAAEWRIDLRAMGYEGALEGPISLGFGYEADTVDGGRASWGEGGERWFNKRLLGRLSLVEDEARFGTIRGRTAWEARGTDAPPARVTATLDSGDYRVTVPVDRDTGRFEMVLPEGRYTFRASDSRTVSSEAASRERAVRAGKTSRAGKLRIGLPEGRPAALADELRAEHNINAIALGVVENGEATETFASGTMPDGGPVAEDALFRMASVSKPVAALTVLRMVDAGLWSLDEPLAAFAVPEAIADDPLARKVTTRMVLRHLSGLPNTHSGDGLTFVHEPGTQQHYSGEAFYWMRDAIEAKFGVPFQALAETHLFDPAGLASSTFSYPADGDTRYVGKLHGDYLFDPPGDWDESKIVGGLLTTADDLARLITFVNGGAGLSEELWGAMTTPNDPALVPEGETDRFGLGWIVGTHDRLTLSHGGSEYGARTYLLLLPEEESGFAVATNATGGLPAIRALYHATLGRTRDLPAVEAEFAEWESFDW